jgi:hypothetical protein
MEPLTDRGRDMEIRTELEKAFRTGVSPRPKYPVCPLTAGFHVLHEVTSFIEEFSCGFHRRDYPEDGSLGAPVVTVGPYDESFGGEVTLVHGGLIWTPVEGEVVRGVVGVVDAIEATLKRHLVALIEADPDSKDYYSEDLGMDL